MNKMFLKSAAGFFAILLSATAPAPLIAEEYSLDDLEWVILFPADQIFDSQAEPFQFDLKDLAPGEHTVIVRARDFVGNTFSVSMPFTVK